MDQPIEQKKVNISSNQITSPLPFNVQYLQISLLNSHQATAEGKKEIFFLLFLNSLISSAACQLKKIEICVKWFHPRIIRLHFLDTPHLVTSRPPTWSPSHFPAMPNRRLALAFTGIMETSVSRCISPVTFGRKGEKNESSSRQSICIHMLNTCLR